MPSQKCLFPTADYIQIELFEYYRIDRLRSCKILVGARGFEPPTSSTPLKRATELRYAPTFIDKYSMQ